MSVDTIGDFLTIIRNGVLASKRYVIAPYAKLQYQVAQLLEQEGFVKSVSVLGDTPADKKIKIELKYVGGESAIHEINRVSTPGCRLYKGYTNIAPVIGGLGVSILSTNKGIVTNKKARQLAVGGEVICVVW